MGRVFVLVCLEKNKLSGIILLAPIILPGPSHVFGHYLGCWFCYPAGSITPIAGNAGIRSQEGALSICFALQCAGLARGAVAVKVFIGHGAGGVSTAIKRLPERAQALCPAHPSSHADR